METKKRKNVMDLSLGQTVERWNMDKDGDGGLRCSCPESNHDYLYKVRRVSTCTSTYSSPTSQALMRVRRVEPKKSPGETEAFHPSWPNPPEGEGL